LQRLTRKNKTKTKNKNDIDIEIDIDKKDRISLIQLTPQAYTVADVVIKSLYSICNSQGDKI
jgi:hypothetical protein